jgi:hypothetical protein
VDALDPAANDRLQAGLINRREIACFAQLHRLNRAIARGTSQRFLSAQCQESAPFRGALALARVLSRVAVAIHTFATSQTESASRIATVSAGSASESLFSYRASHRHRARITFRQALRWLEMWLRRPLLLTL